MCQLKTVLDVLVLFFDNDNTKPMIHVISEGNLDKIRIRYGNL